MDHLDATAEAENPVPLTCGCPPSCIPTPAATDAARRQPRPHRLPVLLILLIVLLGYAAFERLSTRANADRVITFESYGNDAVAIGLTDDQPGFILLSRLPAAQVDVSAEIATSWLTGTHTAVRIHLPDRSQRIRLRNPLVILIERDGSIRTVDVAWSRADFQTLLHAADCETECREHVHRCGAPLAEITAALARWPQERVPSAIREFIRAAGR